MHALVGTDYLGTPAVFGRQELDFSLDLRPDELQTALVLQEGVAPAILLL